MVKTLTIRDDVYRKLVAIKTEAESFSELFERLVDEHGPIQVLGQLRGSMDFADQAEKEAFLRETTSKRAERR